MDDVPEIQFIDTTLRDGPQSLWGGRLSTAMMLAVIDDLNAAGFESMEFGAPGGGFGATSRAAVDEDPDAWFRQGTPRARNTALRATGGMGGGLAARKIGSAQQLGTDAASRQELAFRHLVDQGITVTRTSDCWNNYDRFAEQVRAMEKIGMRTVANLIYSISPRHTDEYYVQKTTEAAAMHPYRICFKDVNGILTAERARVLIPLILSAAGEVPVEFHAHCCTGMAAMCILIAAEAGIRYIHTGIPPLAEGSAQPSIFTAVQNLKELGFDCSIDLKPLERASEVLFEIARREGYAVGKPAELDYRQYKHQVPGGMISHFARQLREVGQEHRLPEALVETAQVRADLGYPIMVTPLSQFVGSQAAVNVITGKRYEMVTDEIILYALGYYGDEAIEVMDPNVRAAILKRKRADELMAKLSSSEAVGSRRPRQSSAAPLNYNPTPDEPGMLYRDVTPYKLESSPEARWLRDLPVQDHGSQLIELQRADVHLKVGLRAEQ